jgi:superfamily II helicase
MFYCKNYKCRLTEAACIRRQEISRKKHAFTHLNMDECIDCEPGKVEFDLDEVLEEGLSAPAEKTKKCKECGQEKLLSAFAKHNTSADGYMSVCEACRQAKAHQTVVKRQSVSGENFVLSYKGETFSLPGKVVEKITSEAADQFRTPLLQAAWVLSANNF